MDVLTASFDRHPGAEFRTVMGTRFKNYLSIAALISVINFKKHPLDASVVLLDRPFHLVDFPDRFADRHIGFKLGLYRHHYAIAVMNGP